MQQLPENGRPITKWGNRDEACEDVAKRLRIAVEEWNSRAPRSATPAPDRQPEKEREESAVLHRIFASGQSVTLRWMQTALVRAAAVARIANQSGQPMGTGFLVDPAAFGLSPSTAPLLLSCSFVIGPEPNYIQPKQAVVRFQIAGVERGVKSVVWSSPVHELSAILVTLDGPVTGVQPIPVAVSPWRADDPAKPISVVVIGHPGGRDIEFSLHDTPS